MFKQSGRKLWDENVEANRVVNRYFAMANAARLRSIARSNFAPQIPPRLSKGPRYLVAMTPRKMKVWLRHELPVRITIPTIDQSSSTRRGSWTTDFATTVAEPRAINGRPGCEK